MNSDQTADKEDQDTEYTVKESEYERDDVPQRYEVTAESAGDKPQAEVWTVNECATPAEAVEQLRERKEVGHIYEVEPVVERVEFAVAGTSGEMADVFESLALAEETADCIVTSRDPDAAVRPIQDATDDSEAALFAVDDWREVTMEVTGIREGLGPGDGISSSAANFATDDSTVEFQVGDTVVAKIIQEQASE